MHRNQTLILCSPQIGIDPESNLGGAVADRETLKALARLGVRILIPLPRGERAESVVGWEIIPTRRHRWKYYEYNWIFRRAIDRLVREGRTINILRAHSVHSTGLGVLSAARRYAIPSHLEYHHWERHAIRNAIERWTMGRYDVVTTVSEHSRRELIGRYGLRNRIEVVYNGVRLDYEPGEADRDLRERFAGKRILLFVGVLVARKNLSFLLRVFRLLREQGRDDLVLIVVGEGPLEGSLRRQARDLGLGRAVEFTGRVGESQKIAYYRLCDIFVFPSLVEGFGLAPAEAMAFGKPVVASNRTSLPEVVADGQTGFLADPTDERDFAEKIARLLGSPEMREKMGQAGRRRVAERFTPERRAERLIEIYRSLLAGKGKR